MSRDPSAAPPPLAPEGTPVPARVVDPTAFLPSFDDRHHHAELRVSEGRVTGAIDASLLSRLRDWAAGEGLEAAVDPIVGEPVTVVRGGRLRLAPGPHATAVTEVRTGTPAEALATRGGWRRIRSGPEGYLGWIREADLATGGYDATHRVRALRGHLYSAPRVQGDALGRVAWGDLLRVRDASGAWAEAKLPDGRTAFLLADLLAPVDAPSTEDPLEAWRGFLGTPYLWGGGSAWGIDCSGFTQLVHRMAGIDLPRDADEQFAFGTVVESPRAGDLVCFRGHVGLYLGEDRMAHASGRTMRVIESEPFLARKDRERFLGWVRIR